MSATVASESPLDTQRPRLPDRAKRLAPILHGFRIDSERGKKQLSLFENLNRPEIAYDFDTLADVSERDPVQPFDEEDDPITEFIRWTLIELKKKRGDMRALELRSGISSGYCTKLTKDESRVMRVGMDFVRKFAPAMGYKDLGEFFLAAGKWWDETGRALIRQYKEPDTIPDPELRRAVEAAKGIATPAVVKRTLTEYPNQIGKRNYWWWIERMIEIAKEDFHRKADDVVEKKSKDQRRKAKEPPPPPPSRPKKP